MIGTLIKHEVIRTRALLLTIAGAASAVGVVGALTAATGWPVLSQFGVLLGLAGTFGLVPALQLAQAVDYWRSSYGRIGYFTQTLPVRGSRIYWAKVVWGAVVLVAGLAGTLAIGLVVWFGTAAQVGLEPLDIFPLVGDALALAFKASPWLTAVAAPVLLLLLYGLNTVTLLSAASLGSEQRMHRLGLGGPVLVWFALHTATQLVMLVMILAIPFGLGITTSGELELLPVDMLTAMLQDIDLQLMPIGFVPALLVLVPLMVWRTARSWNSKVSLA
ncbi:hypothetical protein [Agrococcus sp. DT81.2]|uniref:hypothetical protein n=1 Tax=Agrococcus sp. DT81.2 TaxID=3393414 RepID=UPI003CE5C299